MTPATSTGPAYRIDGRLVAAPAFYAAACDPRRSIAVEACAGAGKTWMLVSRILRALLDGAQPQEILALTFTRKAAGEMRARLDEWLRALSVVGPLDDAGSARLAAELQARGVDSAAARTLVPSLAGLHEALLRSGRSVAVRSFHAWFAQLLAAAPLDTLRALGLPAQPELVEDTDDLRDELFARFHRAVQADLTLRAAYADLIGRHRLGRVTAWLETAWKRRLEVERADAAGTLARSVPDAAALWPDCAGLSCTEALVLAPPLADELDALTRALGNLPNKTPRSAAHALQAALALTDGRAAYAAARKALMTEAGQARKHMGELPQHEAACTALREVGLRVDQQQAHEDHAHMVVLVRVLLREYARLKHGRGLADMGDLESAALSLLSDPVLAGWLPTRLDAQLKHLLIDEFQDTSPLQWHALFGWLSSYSGAGGGASGRTPPSLFIVGDPKQSIYRFRRAEPRVFEAAKEFVVQALGGSVLACDHTRRCADRVVRTLNAVFEPAAASGLWPGFRTHTTDASADSGQVSRLPDVLRPPKAAPDGPVGTWRDTLTQPRHEPEEQLRMREARQVARAIQSMLAQGRPAADLMVLARKRVALRAVSDALSALQVPHVVPEAMILGEEPEARDLLAVLDVLASPGHDLSLAQALKSPLFGAADADLLALSRAARAANQCWWDTLVDADAVWSDELDRARTLLLRWARTAPWLPPHDLLDAIVHEGDFVARLAARVPVARRATALQVVDGLLAAALQLDGGRYASPYGFVRALRSRKVEAAAVPARDAVRLLTVHGAKGLEAPVVFIVDADPERPRTETGTMLVDWPVQDDAPRCVAFIAVDSRPPPSLRALQEEELRARAREELNGLYVAMTRAAEHLVVSRTEPFQPPDTPSWWARVSGLAGEFELAADTPAPPGGTAASITWLDLPALRAGPTSGAPERDAEPERDAQRAALGTAVHRVLEWAASDRALAPAGMAAAAAAAAAQCALPLGAAAEVARLASSVLDNPACRRFFDPGVIAWAGNEVPVLVDGQGGRIDRLVAFDEPTGRVWWVLDYKLHESPDALPSNRVQRAGYVQAVRALQPQDRVVGAFVTGAGRLVEIEV